MTARALPVASDARPGWLRGGLGRARRRLAMSLLSERERSVLCRLVTHAQLETKRWADEDAPVARDLYDSAL